jgi:FixJ family two-component response regulator
VLTDCRGYVGTSNLGETSPVVFIVDDDASVRAALESLLRSVGMKVESYCSAPEFLRTARLDALACLILDIRLPGTSGLELQQELARRHTDLPIVFISGHGDIRMSVRAIKAGAVEFLTKPFHDADLLEAVEQALTNARTAHRAREELHELDGRFAALTPRERQVLTLVVTGLLNKQIAAELGIREVTVKIHRGQVMQKTRAQSVAELVRMSERLGIRPASH